MEAAYRAELDAVEDPAAKLKEIEARLEALRSPFRTAEAFWVEEIIDPLTIVRVHVLGNVLGPIFVYATSLISVSMILASGLSFLGLGTKPPEPEWGLMLNTLRTAIYVQPWVAVLPGACIFITSICFNLVSDGLRQAMDVKG